VVDESAATTQNTLEAQDASKAQNTPDQQHASEVQAAALRRAVELLLTGALRAVRTLPGSAKTGLTKDSPAAEVDATHVAAAQIASTTDETADAQTVVAPVPTATNEVTDEPTAPSQ
jgi:hypothetical protein